MRVEALEQKETKISEWRHPGGKLRDKGAKSLSDAERKMNAVDLKHPDTSKMKWTI